MLKVAMHWPGPGFVACLPTPLKGRSSLTGVSKEDSGPATAYLECLLWIIELQFLKERPCRLAVSLRICCLQTGVHTLSA